MKELDIKEIHRGVETTKIDLEAMFEKISNLQRTIQNFHGLEDALKGKTGTAIRSFYNEIHQPFLTYLYQSMIDYKDRLEKMKQNIHAFEPHHQGYISEGFLENELHPKLDKAKKTTMNITDEANQLIASIQDIVYVPRLDDSEFQGQIHQAKQKVENVIDELHMLDNQHTSQLQQTQNDLHTMRNYLSEMTSKISNGTISITNFDMASIKNGTAFQKVIQQNYEKGNIVIDEKNIKHLPLQTIAAAKEEAMNGMNGNFRVILNHAYDDLEQGNITREGYFEILAMVLKTKESLTEEELQEDVPKSVIGYLNDNKGKISKDLSKDLVATGIQQAGIATTKIGGLITVITGIKGPSGPKSFVMQNPRTSGISNAFKDTGNKITSTGKWLGRGFMATGFGIGMYEDMVKKDKSVGEAISHNTASLGVGIGANIAGASLTAAGLTALSVSNPAGWAVLGGIALGTAMTVGFNYAYDINFLGLQDGLDYVGQKLDDIGTSVKDTFNDTVDTVGEAIESGLDAINPMNWGWS